MSEQKKQWIGWALTIVLAVIGAVATSSGRMSSMEIKFQTHEQQIIELKREYIDRIKSIECKQDKQIEATNELTKSIIRMEGKLDLKQDKQFKN